MVFVDDVIERDVFIFNLRSVTVTALTSDQNIEMALCARFSVQKLLRLFLESAKIKGELHIPHAVG